ncbi:gliding motility-associated peptidyl-prolyl isomerase GldI [Mariniflexile ostreae]|uniref:Peptidyl-prolyl cis-trans isomerase n=1 Tax=Mariniflexile ostreae TaxID=1520892 RepID=A0ABV5F8V4_9FLAO
MNKKAFLLIATLLAMGCKTPEARRPISVTTGSFIDASVARNQRLNAEEEAEIERIISKQADHEFIASETGFWYYYNTKTEIDSLQTPDFGDIVNFIYDVKTLDGHLIYSKEEVKVRNYAMDQEALFSGMREGLKLMKSGETATFLFPSQKAFGYYGDENKIGTNIPLMCEVTVHSITENKSN